MDVVVVPGDRVGAVGADLVLDGLAGAGRRDATLMPALGTSALGVYREMAQRRDRGGLLPADLRLVQLDEYVGVPDDDPRSLFAWLLRDVAGPLGVPTSRVIRLGGGPAAASHVAERVEVSPSLAAEPTVNECRRYDGAVAAAGGIDVAVLGLGPNGHLGFNEPPSPPDAPTRRVALTPASLASNAPYWPGLDVPRQAVTAGMSTILGARRIILVVVGPAKRAILHAMLTDEIGPNLPASWLRRHAGATVLADEAAWPAELPRAPFEEGRSADRRAAGGYS
jgi:glucosamine-6-phosphate deaminase